MDGIELRYGSKSVGSWSGMELQVTNHAWIIELKIDLKSLSLLKLHLKLSWMVLWCSNVCSKKLSSKILRQNIALIRLKRLGLRLSKLKFFIVLYFTFYVVDHLASLYFPEKSGKQCTTGSSNQQSVTKIMEKSAIWTILCFYPLPPLKNVERQWVKITSSYVGNFKHTF